jgi:sRNA-binding regulator protein Hfq
MANPTHLLPPGAHSLRSSQTRILSQGNAAHDGHATPSAADLPAAAAETTHTAEPEPVSTGPRKLIRPTLPARALTDRSFSRRDDPVLAHHAAMAQTHAALESSHAEAFYFQKQMQTQTLMVFVLEDGETIEGYIEWYDRNAIKVRNSSRTLIYKSGIKYLYKASENRT